MDKSADFHGVGQNLSANHLTTSCPSQKWSNYQGSTTYISRRSVSTIAEGFIADITHEK